MTIRKATHRGVTFVVSVPEPTDKCPCDSGKVAAKCCFSGGRWLRNVPSGREPPTPTGIANPDCYAAELHDCVAEMSCEHPIPESLIRDMGGSCITSGQRWAPPGGVLVGAKSMGSRILCKRHNNALSECDSEGVRLARTLNRYWDAFRLGRRGSAFKVFSGDAIERFLMKVLAGVTVVNHSRRPPLAWLKCIFHGARMPKGWGMYYDAAPLPHTLGLGTGVVPMMTGGDECAGGSILLGGLVFTAIFSSEAVSLNGPDWLYRPEMIITHDADVGRALYLSWRHGPGTREWVFNGPVRLFDPDNPNDSNVLSSGESRYLERFRKESPLARFDAILQREAIRKFLGNSRRMELTRFGGRFRYAAFFTECISSNSIGLL
jgi:hypothetical protein